MREIALDTETTGLDPEHGHRIVEIGCVELVNHVPTGRVFHQYLNPERDMPEEAAAVHGLTAERLAGEPRFVEVVEAFLDFVAEAPLVIHNAAFDMRFLNAELRRVGRPPIAGDRAVDTLAIARRKFPGAGASLDALCRRYGVDTSERTLHGALLDAQLLAEVYLELLGGRQPDLALAGEDASGDTTAATVRRTARPPRPHAASPEELAAHAAFLAKLTDPLWETLDAAD
ncbi:MAG: DNA polymerase III subunit epsilon [Rhodospirillaceae bacterium]|nr:DNA polymerase III subunit epsilon [Rhodospirillaceae bacterium]MCA8932535.1 DNA polymerase III subunit epsilon [Rhodospirillaceae bacterium]